VLAEQGKNSDSFDVVFSDLVMPGMNGTELCQEIRGLYRDPQVS
jgi:CheY-like chemotaxis protein